MNSPADYAAFFAKAFGDETRRPYDYQTRLAQLPACESLLIDIPTGLGKAAAKFLARPSSGGESDA